ncbi:MAG: TatD family hydrolase [Oligoflexus sp.]
MIDAHCHISMYPRKQQGELLQKLRARGFEALMMAGYDPKDWQEQRRLSSEQPCLPLLPVFGLHPWHLHELDDDQFHQQLHNLAGALPEAVACGELGLDYYIEGVDRQQQIRRCTMILDLACEQNLPVVIHCVRAHHDMIRLVKERRSKLAGGMVHSFVGNVQIAKSYWDLGLCTSFSPFTMRTPRDDLYQQAPSELFLIETDAPQAIDPKLDWQFPNMTTPEQLITVAETVARARSVSPSEIFAINRRNIISHFPKAAAHLRPAETA